MSAIFNLTQADSVQWLAVLVDAAAKGLVVLLAAAAASLLLRRGSAAVRHMVWTLSVLGLVCVPVLSVALPQLQVPLLPDWARPQAEAPAPPSPAEFAEAPPQAIAPFAAPAVPPAASLVEVPAFPSPSVSAGPPAALPAEVGPAPPATADIAAPRRPAAAAPIHWSAWVLLAWAAGVAVLVMPLLIGTLTVRRAIRRAGRVTDEDWLTLLDRLRRELGVRRAVTLLRSAWSNIPLTCGVLRPVIVLPAEADDWSADRRKVVLLHELAHVKRADCLTQLAARIVRVLHWFNPLVWLAGRMLRIERERACDDLVLASGHKASDYASHLLEIVRTLRSVRCPSLAAVAMAHRSQFEGRMLAILDARRNRRALTRLGVLIAAILVAALVIPVSVMRVTAADSVTEDLPTEQPAAQPAEAKAATVESKPTGRRVAATLPGGATVELLAVGGLHTKVKQWWRPDGSDLSHPPYDGMKDPPEKYRYELVIRYEGPSDASDRWNVAGAAAGTNTGRPIDKDGKAIENLRVFGAGFPGSPSMATVRYGLATGSWQTLALCSPAGRMSFLRELHGDRIVLSSAESENGTAVIRVATTVVDPATRVVAVKKSGGLGACVSVTGHGATGIAMRTYRFKVSLEDIDHFEFQSRPYEWVEFKGVSLAAGRKTNVQVKVAAKAPAVRQGSPQAPDGAGPNGASAQPAAREAYIPDADTKGAKVVLDLATGEMLPAGEGDQFTHFTKLGKGDLAYDRALICLRGAKAYRRGDLAATLLTSLTKSGDITGYELPKLPCRLLIVTGDGPRYEVEVLRVRDDGIDLRYRRLGSRLEFRIAPSPSALDKAELASYRDWLKAGRVGFWWKDGRIAGIAGRMPDHAWLPVAGEVANTPRLVTGEYDGRRYLLVSDKPGQTMLPGEGKNAWGLAKVYRRTENSGRPAVGFDLDDRGTELFAALTKANIGYALAIVVDGKVVSAPVLKTALGKQGMITGRFSDQEVKAIVKALKAGMPPGSPQAPNGASTQPAPTGTSAKGPRAQAAKRTAAKVQIAAMGLALDTFEIDVGRYPNTTEGLAALVRQPDGVEGWRGPYVRKLVPDPWARPYVYRCPGAHNKDGFDLSSAGPDGREGTDDDVTNWPPPRKPLPGSR